MLFALNNNPNDSTSFGLIIIPFVSFNLILVLTIELYTITCRKYSNIRVRIKVFATLFIIFSAAIASITPYLLVNIWEASFKYGRHIYWGKQAELTNGAEGVTVFFAIVSLLIMLGIMYREMKRKKDGKNNT